MRRGSKYLLKQVFVPPCSTKYLSNLLVGLFCALCRGRRSILIKKFIAHLMTIHIFGATSFPCGANFFLHQTTVEFGHLFNKKITEIANNNFYVNNCLLVLSFANHAATTQRELCELPAKRRFV